MYALRSSSTMQCAAVRTTFGEIATPPQPLMPVEVLAPTKPIHGGGALSEVPLKIRGDAACDEAAATRNAAAVSTAPRMSLDRRKTILRAIGSGICGLKPRRPSACCCPGRAARTSAARAHPYG